MDNTVPILQIDNQRVSPRSTLDVYRVYSIRDTSDWKEVKRYKTIKYNMFVLKVS